MKIISITLVSVILLTACGSDDSGGSSGAGDVAAKPRIALVMKSLANEFFVNMASGAEAHQAAHAEQYELIVNGIRNESDLAQQVNLVDQMISSGVQAIVIAPADSRASTNAALELDSSPISDEPQPCGMSFTSIISLTPTGHPCKAPKALPSFLR